MKSNEKGLVSITVTVIFMMVITLVVTSFALVVRREQRRSLDRQLSSQAFYAAETGVQDAVAAISFPSSSLDTNIDNCDQSEVGSFIKETSDRNLNFDPKISDNVEYTCVLINRTPSNWEGKEIKPDDGGFIVPINTDNPINNLVVSWQSADGNTAFGSNTPFNLPKSPNPANPSSLTTPLIKLIIMPAFDGVNPLSRADIDNNSHTMYLYPSANGSAGVVSTVNYRAGGTGWSKLHPDQGRFVSGNCNSGNTTNTNGYKHCNVSIDSLGGTNYYVYVQPLFKAMDLDLAAFDAGGRLPLKNSQADIDVTGRASDVLRRIKVRVPVGEGVRTRNLTGIMPPGALVTEDDICKKWERTTARADNLCDGSSVIISGGGGGGGGGVVGNASVGECLPGEPRCVYQNGQWVYQSSPSGSSTTWRWHSIRTNTSNISPNPGQAPMSDVQSCVYEWGDGTTSTYGPYENNPSGYDPCNTDGGRSYHLYPNMQAYIQARVNPVTGLAEDIDGNGNGCIQYRARLTVNFTPASGRPQSVYQYKNYIPGGIADDPGQPCYNNHTHEEGVW